MSHPFHLAESSYHLGHSTVQYAVVQKHLEPWRLIMRKALHVDHPNFWGINSINYQNHPFFDPETTSSRFD